ncbi:MAG: hypothetical protein N2F24_04835, partial [Deltaproteobacteria bacterium]
MPEKSSQPKYVLLLFLIFAILILAGCSTPQGGAEKQDESIEGSGEPAHTDAPPENYQPPTHVIGIRQIEGVGEFYNIETGKPLVVRGVNYVFVPQNGSYNLLLLKVGVYNAARTRKDFNRLANNGYNTVRLFIDHCGSGSGCIGGANNQGLSGRYLDNMADMLAAANEAGIFILFTSNDLPDQGGYSEQANSQSGDDFAGYRPAYYLTAEGVKATQRSWADLLTGLHARGAPTGSVLGWQLLNEQWLFLDQPPLSLTTGMVTSTTGTYDMSIEAEKWRMVSEGLIHYIAEVKAEILKHDPTALVTMGFFAPGVAPDWYVETASLLAGSDLDFFDFHAYPGFEPFEELATAFGMKGYDAKPIVLGEYGSFRDVYPELDSGARAITKWQAISCELGFDGWLYWTYYPADESVGDRTWGFTDEGGYFLDLLSPINHPDP